jgi:hypothetical protein
MTWYAASAILYFKHRDRKPQKEFLVWENVYLINAASPAKAKAEAKKLAKADAVDDPEQTLDGLFVKTVFAGLSKVVEVGPSPLRLGPSPVKKLESGVEATWSEFVVKSEAEVKALAAGKAVKVLYRP